MTFFALSLGFNMCAFANNLQGVSHRQVFRNPLFSSASPSDFWGYRWNMVIHSTLKRGVFKPMRKAGFSSTFAIISAFLASGLLHDYSWMVMFRPTVAQRDENGNCADCWSPIIGKQSVFFLWCGITMILERPIGKLAITKWVTKNLPRPIMSTMVVLTVLPFAHWFAGDWIVGKYFEQLSQGLFKVTYEAPWYIITTRFMRYAVSCGRGTGARELSDIISPFSYIIIVRNLAKLRYCTLEID